MVAVQPPVEGPIGNWATSDDVAAVGGDPNALDPAQLAIALNIATTVLWYKSGQQWSGVAGETLRPPCRMDLCEQITPGSEYGYVPDLIEGVWYNFTYPYGMPSPAMGLVYEGGHRIPRIDLGQYPVIEIVRVLIDGVEFPYNNGLNYRLDDWRYLVRTDGQIWPSAQNLLLDDSQPGTWSVSLRYGLTPPQIAVTAAAELAHQLCLHTMGDTQRCQLPLRVTTISRQGVAYSLPDVMAVVDKGRTGLYYVDLFLQTVNPGKLQRPARVLTPDLKPYRRVNSQGGANIVTVNPSTAGGTGGP